MSILTLALATFVACPVMVASLTSTELEAFNSTVNAHGYMEGDNVIIKSTGTPDHETGTFPGNHNPNSIETQDYTFRIPANPSVLSSQPGCLKMGPIGVATNGIPFFNPYTANGDNAVEGENAEVFDLCEAHPDQIGSYHYHHVPVCLDYLKSDQLLGVALDGHPIYGPVRGDGKNVTSADLDECHGTTYEGRYRYYITRDFPYILGCFRGSPGTVLNGQGNNEPTGLKIGPTNSGKPNDEICFYAFDSEKGLTEYPNNSGVNSRPYFIYYFSLLFIVIALCFNQH